MRCGNFVNTGDPKCSTYLLPFQKVSQLVARSANRQPALRKGVYEAKVSTSRCGVDIAATLPKSSL